MIKFHVQTDIERPVGEVFEYVTDPERLSTWQTNTASVTQETDGPFGLGTRLHEVHRAPGGRELHSVVEVSQYEPDQRLELRIVEGPLPVDGLFVFAPSKPGSTRVELFGSGRPSGAMRLAQPLLRLAVRRQFAGNLRSLKRAMEASSYKDPR
jgi:uncharacterized protein YndB with AHSA1/START domain